MKKSILLAIVLILFLAAVPAYAAGTRTFVKTDGGDLSSNIDFNPSITGKANIQSVTVHFIGATSSDVYVQLDSEFGATYDTVLVTSDSVLINDFFWLPEDTFLIEKADTIRVHIDSDSLSVKYTITIRGDYQ